MLNKLTNKISTKEKNGTQIIITIFSQAKDYLCYYHFTSAPYFIEQLI